MRAVWSLLVAISPALLSAGALSAEQPRTLLTQDQFSQLTAISRDLQALKSATTTRREMFANARRELAGMRATIDRLLANGGDKMAPPSEVPEAMPVFARLPGTVRDHGIRMIGPQRRQLRMIYTYALHEVRDA